MTSTRRPRRNPIAADQGPAPAPGAGCWLVKQEPESYSWERFMNEGRTSWDGVRNYQARNNLGAMREGDHVLYYESGDSKSVAGLARVVRAAYADPTAEEAGWLSVELKAERALARPVSLAQIKADRDLASIALVRNSRLSVMPLSREAFERIVRLGS